MRLHGSWLDAVYELDAFYPKKVNILVDKFQRDFPPEDEVRIIVMWEPDGRIISEVMQYPDFYDYVFTYHQYVLDNNPKAHMFLGVTMFADPAVKHEKRFGVSTVVGHKTGSTFPGYDMRHRLWFRQEEISIPKEFYLSGGNHFGGEFIKTAHGNINVKGQKRLHGTKDEAFSTMFHIAIENAHMDNFFTEKICDCFLTKTVPIYVGAKNIGEFFNAEGILQADSVDDIIAICNVLNEKDYYDMSFAIEENYQKALGYVDYNKMLTKRVLEVLNG